MRGVWRKNDICGKNVKNAGEKKILFCKVVDDIAENVVEKGVPRDIMIKSKTTLYVL